MDGPTVRRVPTPPRTPVPRIQSEAPAPRMGRGGCVGPRQDSRNPAERFNRTGPQPVSPVPALPPRSNESAGYRALWGRSPRGRRVAHLSGFGIVRGMGPPGADGLHDRPRDGSQRGVHRSGAPRRPGPAQSRGRDLRPAAVGRRPARRTERARTPRPVPVRRGPTRADLGGEAGDGRCGRRMRSGRGRSAVGGICDERRGSAFIHGDRRPGRRDLGSFLDRRSVALPDLGGDAAESTLDLVVGQLVDLEHLGRRGSRPRPSNRAGGNSEPVLDEGEHLPVRRSLDGRGSARDEPTGGATGPTRGNPARRRRGPRSRFGPRPLLRVRTPRVGFAPD